MTITNFMFISLAVYAICLAVTAFLSLRFGYKNGCEDGLAENLRIRIDDEEDDEEDGE